MSVVLAALSLTACELDKIAIPKTTPTVALHLVLNASVATQVMFLERTLTGSVAVHDGKFDANNPIATAGGVPIIGATAEITDSTGRVVRAVEDKIASTGKGNGVYRFNLGGLRIGAKYDLRVRTAEGEEVTASTRLPRPTITSPNALTRTFNRDHDSLIVQWSAAAETRSYALRVESPFGPFFLFTDSTRFRLNGQTRNLFSENLQRLFIPGFRQDIIVAAVDSNFYDYYRTNNDPFTGSGIISRISGGLGLFGSMVTLTSGSLTVVADINESIEGIYRATPAATDLTAPLQITLYVESKAARTTIPDALSGRYTTAGASPKTDGIIGERIGSSVSFAVLNNQLAGDTVDVFTGVLEGKTITGTYKKRPGVATFVKQ